MASILRFFYTHSIAQAFDGAGMEAKLAANRSADSTLIAHILYGATDAVKDFARGFFISIAVTQFTNRFFDTTKPAGAKPLPFSTLMVYSVVEEIVIRGLIQNVIFYAQAKASQDAPDYLKDTRVFEVLVSTTFRVVLMSIFYASLNYFMDSGKRRSKAEIAASVLNTLIQPLYTIAYEETGSLIHVTTAHIGRNLIVEGLARRLGALNSKLTGVPVLATNQA